MATMCGIVAAIDLTETRMLPTERLRAVRPGHCLEVRDGRRRRLECRVLDLADVGYELRLKDPRPVVEGLQCVLPRPSKLAQPVSK